MSLRQAQMFSFTFFISARVNDPHFRKHSAHFRRLSLCSLYIVTWNVSQKYPDHITLHDLLGVENDKDLPDIYIVGLQEVNANPQNVVTSFFK